MEFSFLLLPLNHRYHNNSLGIPNFSFTTERTKHKHRRTNFCFPRPSPSHHRNPSRASIWCRKHQKRRGVASTSFCGAKEDKKSFQNGLCVGWLKYSSILRRWASGIISIYLFGLTLTGDAHGSPNLSKGFSCEDVSNYYASVDHKEGEDLMKELSTIISPHQSLSYKEVWEALKILDAADDHDPETSSDVTEIYSLKTVSKKLAGKPEGWNREHLWPRSYGLTDNRSLTDLHNIRPADVNVNSSRGNKYYGECLGHSTHCSKPANKEAAMDTEADKDRWAPPLQVRGDIARALMYMAVGYGYNQSDGSPNLHLSNSPSMENSEMGLLSTLLEWNKLDPPSRTEQLRNNRVCELYQHNRNPFIDHPEYANLIWKQAIPSSQTMYSHSNAWINEFHYNNRGKDQNEFVEIIVRPSTNNSRLKLVFYNGANGRMYKSLSLSDKRFFHVTEDGSGFFIYTVFIPLQNGPGDGLALVEGEDSDGKVIQFVSYQGVVRAVDGPASGKTSVDIGVYETEGSSGSDSLVVLIRNFYGENSRTRLPQGKEMQGRYF